MFHARLRRTVLACIVVTTFFQSSHAGIVVDLMNSPSGSINGAQFFRAEVNPGGTGNLNPFVRLQHANGPSNNSHSGTGLEQGYNTSGRPVQYDENTDGNFTRDLTFGEIPIVTIEGADYLEFILDINEPLGAMNRQLSLDQVNIYTSDAGAQTGLQNTLGDLRYSFGPALNDNTVLMDASLTSGSGQGDLRMYVPLTNFAGVGSHDFVSLYSHFGNYGDDYRTGGGFEEWSVLTVVPGPTSLTAIALACLLGCSHRRRT